jgi:hypothetical protein
VAAKLARLRLVRRRLRRAIASKASSAQIALDTGLCASKE